MIEAEMLTEEDIYFTDQLLEVLEKLGLKSAAPKDMDEALRRHMNTSPVTFEPMATIKEIPSIDELNARIRKRT